ncbi:MAG: substrate-binding domain-containing protein [Thermoguttaceae bacterium]|nr:substrate-binding domain-containing protein [Thermoguttaceae bacterium]
MADKLVADIRSRGLSVGDGYLTSEQAGRMLGVRKYSANLAMRYLADRDILVRKRRRGTFVGSGVATPRTPHIGSVHFLTPRYADRPDRGPQFDQLQAGVEDVLRHASVHFDILPEHHVIDYVRGLTEHRRRGDGLMGLVPSSCPRDVYRYVQDLDLPAVVLGSDYPDTESLPSVDADFQQMGRLMTEYLLERGHRRLALLTYRVWYPGENILLDAINDALMEVDAGRGKLTVRSLPGEVPLFESEVCRLLSAPDRPTGLICRGLTWAEAAERAARSLGLSVPEDVTIIHEERGVGGHRRSPYPSVVRSRDEFQTARLVTQMLKDIAEGNRLKEKHVRLPVELRQPEQTQAK